MKVRILDLGVIDSDTNALVALQVRASLNNQSPTLKFEPFPVWAVLIETQEAKILLDTGIAPDYKQYQAAAAQENVPYRHTPEQTIEHQLELCGVKPEEIDYVVMSHLHWDHAGNIGLFKNAKVIVQRDEMIFALLTTHTVNPFGTYLRRDCDVDANWMLIEGDFQLTKDVKILRAPGHAEGLQCLQLTTDDGTMLLTSDACYTSKNWGPPARPAGALHDSKAYFQSIEKLRKIAHETNATVIYGHDIEQYNTLKKAPERLA